MTDPSANPLAFYASELRRLRGIAGMTQEQLAEATTWSAALVAAIETCRRIPSDVFSESADKALGTDGILSRLQALVERASVVPWFKDLVETERKAASIQSYESYIMPGLAEALGGRHRASSSPPHVAPGDTGARGPAQAMGDN